MDFQEPLAGAGQTTYPARVGFSCKNGNSYTYPYSQLSHPDRAYKDRIEKIDAVYPIISNLDTDPAEFSQTWLTSSDITFSDSDTGVPAYAQRGYFVFALKSATSHPVLSCNTWINDVSVPVSSANADSPAKCPGAFDQLTYPYVETSTAADYTFYFIPISAGSAEGRLCGYLNDGFDGAGSLILPTNHDQVNGANIYRYLTTNSAKNEITEFSNSKGQAKAAPNEPLHLYLCCLP